MFLWLVTAAVLQGCASGAHVGIGVPVGPFSIGVGLGGGGVSAGVGAGAGPIGVGVGVNPHGQVMGSAGVGVAVPVGGARVGAGVGASQVLHDPSGPKATAPDSVPQPSAAPLQWRDAHGQQVPECRVQGRC